MFRMFSSLKEIMQIENPGFYLYMFKLISTPNRMAMKRLVYNGYISSNQLQFEIMELFYHLYETPIEYSMFCHVLNSYLTRYLQRVIHKYHRLTPSISNSGSWILIRPYGYVYKMPIKVENNSVLPEKNICIANNSTDGLLNSNLHVSDKKVLDHPKDFSLPKEIPIVDANECDASFLPKKENNDNVSDLQSFLLPLQQDYTKSSKGYSCQNKCDKTEENAVNLFSSNNFQNNEKPVDNNDFNISDDDEYYDPAQNLIISRYLNSLNSSSSESEVSFSEICCDSDSDDSVMFSDNIVENTQETVDSDKCGAGTSKKIELNASFSFDSDSDDSIEFVEMFDSECLGKLSKGHKYTYENGHDSEIYNSDLFERFDNNSFSLNQKFDSSFRKNDFSGSSFSLTQSKVTVYSTDFEGFSNPCFEDDNVSSQVNLKNINDKWEKSMQTISCEPRQPKRVSFVPLPDLVSVQIFEPDDDNYRYSIFVLDQIRFRNRIQEFEEVIKPYLSPDHRAKVYQYYNSSSD